MHRDVELVMDGQYYIETLCEVTLNWRTWLRRDTVIQLSRVRRWSRELSVKETRFMSKRVVSALKLIPSVTVISQQETLLFTKFHCRKIDTATFYFFTHLACCFARDTVICCLSPVFWCIKWPGPSLLWPWYRTWRLAVLFVYKHTNNDHTLFSCATRRFSCSLLIAFHH